MQGLALLSPDVSADDKIKLTFLLCDLDSTGGVTLAELTRVLEMAKAGMNPAISSALASSPADGVNVNADATMPADATKPADATTPAEANVPFIERSESRKQAAFAQFDVNHDKELDYDEFRAFVLAHEDVMLARRTHDDSLMIP